MTYAGPLGGIVLFGGARQCGRGVLSDDTLWVWNGSRWSVLASGGPSPREDVLLTYDDRRNVLVLYGGRRDGVIHTDTWEWNRSSGWRRATVSVNPGAIEHAAITYDSNRGRVIVFGGARQRAFVNETWEWNGTSWMQQHGEAPPSRIGHSLLYESTSRRVLMYGGFDPSRQHRDLWQFNGARWSLVDSAGPTFTEGGSLVLFRGAPTIVGPGLQSNAVTLNAWTRSNGKWIELPASNSPPVRIGFAATVDTTKDVIAVIGGALSTGQDTPLAIWTFDARAWVRH
jgi:hypothetical protein